MSADPQRAVSEYLHGRRFQTDKVGEINFGPSGLVPAVIQDVSDGTVLMVAYMDEEALLRTLSTGRTWFYSRSRNEYWCKGETSGNRQHVVEAYYDCDADTLLFKVVQEGSGACHTGERSCFYRAFEPVAGPDDRKDADDSDRPESLEPSAVGSAGEA